MDKPSKFTDDCMITMNKRPVYINVYNDEPGPTRMVFRLSVSNQRNFFSSNYRLRIPSWASLFEALGG